MFGKRSETVPAEVLAGLLVRCADLERRLDVIEAGLRTIKGEWGAAHEQLLRQVQRMRRLKTIDDAEAAERGDRPAEGQQSLPMGVLKRRGNGISPRVHDG